MITLRFRSILWFVTGLALAVVLAWWFAAWRAEAAGPGPGESTLVPVTPVRVLDSRDPVNVGLAGPFVSAVGQDLDVTGAIPTTTGTQTVVPEGATGVVLNVTVVEPSADGFVSIRPADAPGVPATSSLNFTAGQIVPNSVTVALPTSGADAGKIEITYDAFGQPGPTTDVLIDVVGYTTDGGVAGLAAEVASLRAEVDALKSTVGAKLDNVSIETVDGQPTVRFTGVNVQIVDGTGDTAGAVNGLGNLIVGYNENTSQDRSGSHNLVVGDHNAYSSYGGVVFGAHNSISAPSATITAGEFNLASGPISTVSGGFVNLASGRASSVAGGQFNAATGILASVAGGDGNDAPGFSSVVLGGFENSAEAHYSSIAGGVNNKVVDQYDVVVGGDQVTCAIPNNAGACGEVGFSLPD